MNADRSQDAAVRDRNREAWNTERYDAWVSSIGAPQVEARKLVADPRHKLRRLLPYLGDLTGKQVCNVQGSHGRIAVASALLGAQVTVIDFSEENRRYATELAACAGVEIDYHVCDVMEAGDLELDDRFDVVIMELGVLHYHQDLERFFSVVAQLAAYEGRLLIHEFHPVERKLFQAFEGAPSDYFGAELVIADVPNPTADSRSLGQCAYRYWTLGGSRHGRDHGGIPYCETGRASRLVRPSHPRNLHARCVEAAVAGQPGWAMRSRPPPRASRCHRLG